MDSKEKSKKIINEAQSGPQKLGHHSGRKHPVTEKVRDAESDSKTQKRAMGFNERSESNRAEVEGGGIKE